MALFTYKTRPEDFIVTELLYERPDPKGDFHYILFEKKGMTTFMIIDLLIKDFGCNRNMIGIAGLKDKHAITRQWFTISRRDMVKVFGGINNVLAWLRKKGKVIDATYGDAMLKLGNNAGNHFDIVLRPTKDFSAEEKKKIVDLYLDIDKKGVPNFFGEQRFGYGGTNWKIGYQLLSGQIRKIDGDKNTLVEKRFKVQAFASYVFNVYLEEREKRGQLYTKLSGDVDDKKLKSVSGPVPGDDLTLATEDAGKLEQDVFKKVGLTPELFARFKAYGLFGIRRPILMFLKNLEVSRKGPVLNVAFDLSSGSYATIILDYVESLLAKSGGSSDKAQHGMKYEHKLSKEEEDSDDDEGHGKKHPRFGNKKGHFEDKNIAYDASVKVKRSDSFTQKPKTFGQSDTISAQGFAKPSGKRPAKPTRKSTPKGPKPSKHRKGNKPVSKA